MAKYPVISEQHDTERAAVALIDGWLHEQWLLRVMPKDYGNDYQLEAIANRHPDGMHTHVQLKGTRKFKFNAQGRAVFPLETSHLRYYQDKVEGPVFLFVVDVVAKRGWFCHVQAELARLGANLAKQKTVSIPLRIEDSIQDTPRLRATIAEAILFMRELRPGTPQASFRAAAADYETIDPNIKIVKAEVTDGHTSFTFAPKRNFKFSATVRPEKKAEVLPKVREMMEFGRPLKVTSDDVDFAGFPLLDHAKANGLTTGFNFRPGTAIPCEISLSATKGDPFQVTIPALLTTGSVGGLFMAKAPDCPLGLEIRLTRAALETAQSGDIQLAWDLGAWFAQDIRTLPWLEPVTKFWRALFAGRQVSLGVAIKGARLMSGKFGGRKPGATFAGVFEMCEMLTKASMLAQARGFQLNFKTAEALTAFDWDDISAAYNLHFNGRHEQPAPEYRVYLRPAPNNTKLKELGADGQPVRGWSKVVMNPYHIEAFGQNLDLGPAAVEIGPVTIHRLIDKRSQELTCEIQGEATTQLQLSRLSAEELPSATPVCT